MRSSISKQMDQKGFSLLELLLVIAAISILGSVILVAINPTETLRKSRDAQRISDLETLKSALTTYVTDVPTANLDYFPSGYSSHNSCFNNTAFAQIFYSLPNVSIGCMHVADGGIQEGSDAQGTFNDIFFCRYTNNGNVVDGTGWVPVNFNTIPGGSPIKLLPADPVNSVTDPYDPNSSSLVYRYVCQGPGVDPDKPANVFELNAVLESKEYKAKMTDDGGDNNDYYETGSSQKLLGAGTNY